MGEIDTKPIKPVQVALTLFGEKSDQKKHRPAVATTSGDEMDKEKDVEELHKELANYRSQMEARDAAYSQLLHKLEQNKKIEEELWNQLKNSELERDVYLEECRKARTQIDELETKVKEMNDQVLETGKIREQLSHILCELKAVQGELLSIETELAAAQEAKLKASTQAELMETAANMEKERAEELLRNVIDLNESLFMSKQAQKEKNRETELDTETEEMKKRLEMVQELENQLRTKSVLIESLQVELNQANELLSSSDRVVSNVINDMNKLKSDLIGKEGENSDQASKIRELGTEMNQLKLELKNANDEVTRLNCEVEMVTDEVEKVRTEMEEIKGKENEAQIEIAMLKAEAGKRRKDSNGNAIERMKKELEGAMGKVSEFRTRAEQAITRAEAAERAKLGVEEQLRKWREQKQRRKAALAALREESLSREFGSSSSHDTPPPNYQPLGKVLNLKF